MKQPLIIISFFFMSACINNNHCSDAIFPKAEASDFFVVKGNAMYINQNCAKQCKWVIFKHFMYIDAYLFEHKSKIYYIIQDSMANLTDSSRILFDYTAPKRVSYNTLLPLYVWNNGYKYSDKPILTFRYEPQEVFLLEKFYDNLIVKDTIYKFFFKDFNGFIGDDHLLIYLCRSKGIVGMANQVGEIDSDKVIVSHIGNIYGDTLYVNKKYNIE